MKKNFKAKVFTLIALIVLFITAVMANIAINNKTNQTKSMATLTPEDRRSMSYGLVTDKDSKIEGNDFVRFNAYFLADLDNDGYAEKYDGTCRNIKEKSMLYMDVNVLTEGKLTNGVITINGQNFNLGMSMIADEVLKNNYISDNVRNIELKDVNAGTQKLILGKITPKIGNDTNNYSCDTNTITFTGTYVPLEGEPVEVSKTIDLTVDWYGITTAQMIKNTKYDVLADSLEEGEIKFSFQILETAHQLILKENSNKVIIPELCGYAPIEVKCTTSGVTSNYDENTRELTISRESTVNENGMVISTLSGNNTYEVSVKYPEEAYRAIGSYESIIFDIEGYYTGYNNKNNEFENPYKSDVVEDKVEFLIRKDPKENIFNFYVDYIDKKYLFEPYSKYVISNQDIINAYNSDDIPANKKFTVRWQAVRGDQGVVPSMIMSETKKEEEYGDKWDTTLIEDYIENTGIYFTGADAMLGDDGTISVYDNDSNELIKEFTKDEWNTYNSTNPFKYENAVKHIRVETSTANTNSILSVYNVKELNTDSIINTFTVEQVKEFNATHTYLTGICNIEGVGARDRETSDIAYFTHEKSRVSLSLDKKTAIVYEKLNNQKIRIKTLNQSKDDSKWQNGEFLVEVPAEIMNMEINSVTCSKPDVTIDAYELYQDENEKYFIRIITTNDEPDSYEIVIDCNLIPDPRVATVSKSFKLYAYNEFAHEYIVDISDIYDVNQNNDTTEKVGKAEAKIDILAPTSLITMETITDYDETTDSEITIAPNVALVNRDERQAKINIHLTNNYTNEISNVRILGKIPYENNTYIINDVNLKSEFTTEMTSNGVNIPEELPNDIKQNTTVYYSTKENPTKDLQNAENGWKTKDEVADWSNVKSYLICLNDSKLASGQEIEFNYDVTLPENVTLNMAAFSTHAVYFNLDTEDGMIRLYTEPTKVGVRIVKKYVLDLTKYKLNSSVTIPGVTYSLKYSVKNAEGELVEKQNILTTDENGKIILQGLFADTEYTLKEIKAPIECELNDDEIKFTVDENDSLTLTGNNKNNSYSNSKLQLDLEDEIRAKIQINKTKKGTDIKLNNVYFDIADEEGNHITAKTQNGYVEIPGVSLGKTYTLTEKVTPNSVEKNEGKFKFKLTRQGLTDINIEVLESSLLKGEYIFENNLNEICPVIKVNVEDEIRYNLNINKKDNEGNAIKNIKFELSEENSTSKVISLTNASGECMFNRLSLGKTYILKETSANGYYVDGENDYITLKVERDGTLQITKFESNGNIKVLGNPTITEDGIDVNLNVTLENEKIPTYDLKVIKKNEEGYTLSGARFKLKRVFDGKEIVLKVDENGEGIFTGLFEDIEGKNVTGEYELVETFSPEGYRLDDTVLKFSATRDANGKLVFKEIDGGNVIRILPNSEEKDISTDEDTVTIGIVNKPIFSLFKFGDNGVLLPNAKFIITDLQENPAKDVYGNYIGEYDQENDRYVVTTDSEGKISANIAKGIYKAVEVEAPEGYALPTDIKDRIYYFGINESQDATYSDYKGELAWTKENDDEEITSYNKLYKIDNNSLIVYGNKEEKDVFIKYDINGNIIWEIETSKFDICDFNVIDSETYEFIGKYNESEYDYDGNTISTIEGKDNYVIIRINNNGEYIEGLSFDAGENTRYIGKNESGNILIQIENEVFEYAEDGTLLGNIEFDLPVNATIKNSSNGYLAVIHTSTLYNITGSEYVDAGTYAIFYDKNGEYKWYKKLKTMYNDMYVTLNNENNFVIMGEAVYGGHGTINEEKYVYAINDDGEIINYIFINIYNASSRYREDLDTYKNITFVSESGNTENGFIVSGGANTYYYGTISKNGQTLYEFDYAKNSGYMFIFNNDFELIWYQKNNKYIETSQYNPENKNYLTDVEKIGNKYFSISGKEISRYDGIEEIPTIAEEQEIHVNNELKKYDITTEIGQNTEYSRLGGTITGIFNDEYTSDYYKRFVESVKHGYDNEEQIVIEPNNGYYINKITVDGEIFEFKPDETGKVVIPNGYFKNVTQNHHIIVTFERKSLSVKIQKRDEHGNPLKGAKFEAKSEDGSSTYISGATNEDGIAYISVYRYNYGTYIIKEIEAPENYVLSDETKSVTISDTNNGEMPSVEFVNVEKPTITIEKTDEQDNPIKGAKFKINTANPEPGIGELTGVGPDCYIKNEEADYSDLLGELSAKDANYYFNKTANDTYSPNNLYTANTTAWSCMPIDLTDYSEVYLLQVCYNNSYVYQDDFQMYISENEDSNYDQRTKTLNYTGYTNNGNLCECSLNGGKVYYLHFKYIRGSRSGTRSTSINSIKLFGTTKENYYFTEQNGVYEPNNSYVPYSIARSYIPLDLTNCYGKYEIKINAQTQATNPENDHGNVYLTESLDFDNTVKTSIYWGNWDDEAAEYATIINGGKQYYIVMEYVKGYGDKTYVTDVPNDLIINSISISEVGSEFFGETDSQGKCTIHVEDIGKFIIQEIETPEQYVLDDQPHEVTLTADNSNQTVPIINRKKAKIIVHHYLEGTGEEFHNEPVVLAEEETVSGKSGTPYTTAPNMEIEKYTLVKNTDGTYKLPSNATGTFTDEVQHVYYYYNTAPVKLVVHHYLEGTEDKLAEDENSTYEKGDHYKTTPSAEVLESYDLVQVVGDEEKDITQDEVVTYYYVKKQHKITTRVETISYFGKPEKGGEITGEDEKPYETVPHGNSNTKEIKMTPKSGFKIDKVVINQSEDGEEISSEELDINFDIDDTYVLPQIQNIKNDYEIVVRFVPDMGKVIVHHYIEGTTIKIAPDEVIIDEYGNVVETKPTSLENENAKYTLVESPDEPNVVVSREDKEVTYYYQVEYKITTEVIKHDETVNGETVQVKGGSISGENETPYELVMRGRDSTKVIKATPDEGYKIKEITINGETYDFTDKLAEDGTVTLDQFTNVTESKHITVEFERIIVPAKVIVKYLEEGTNKVLKAEETKNGIVGEEYRTSRATITGYEKAGNDPTNANGTMTKDDIIVIYYYKKVVEPTPVDPEPVDPTPVDPTPVDPTPVDPTPTPVTPDEPTPVTPDVPEEPDTPVTPDEPEKQEEPVQPSDNNNNESRSPQTGDNIIIAIITGVIAAIVLVILNRKTLKR